MDFVLTKDDIFLFWMSNLYISIILHSSSHHVSSSQNDKSIAGSFTHHCTHLHILTYKQQVWFLQASGDWEQTESSALLIKQSLVCVSLCLVSSLKSQTLCQTVYCAGVTPQKNMSVHVYLNDLCFILRVPFQKILF